MLTGNNGILQRAVESKEKTESFGMQEQVQIATLSAISDGTGQIKDATLRNELKNTISGVTDNDITGNEKYGWQVKIGNKAYSISSNGEVNEAFWEEIKDSNGNITEIRRVDGTVTGLKIGDVIGYSAIDGISSENKTIISYGTVTGLGENNDQTIEIESGTWKLLGVENGKLKIISDIVGRNPESGETNVSASKILKLQGKIGYQNVEEELNRVCGLYGKGKYAENARSINVEDINKITGYNPNAVGIKNPTEEEIANGTKYGQRDNNPGQYGRRVTYYWSGNADKKPLYTYTGKETPAKLTVAHNNFSWFNGNSWNISNYEAGKTGEICTVTSIYYCYYPTTLTDSLSGDVVGISTDSDEYGLLFDISNFGNGEEERYWLASRCVYCYSYSIAFTSRAVCGNFVSFSNLAYANSEERMNSFISGLGLRPIVYLQSDIKLKEDENGVWQFVND